MSVTIMHVKERLEADNDRNAAAVRALLKEKNIFLVNLMSSPGAGKTTVLVPTIHVLEKKYRVGVMEADMDSDVDAKTIAEKTGAQVIQLHTGNCCHMDAGMTMDGLQHMDLDHLDVIFLENVGNLVCPAEFDVGGALKTAILSVPEGDDKPLKYPLMFKRADVVLENKADTAPIFDYDFDRAENNAKALNPDLVFFRISALKGEGMDSWTGWLMNRIDTWRQA